MTMSAMQETLAAQDQWDFSDLSALYINTTLKKGVESSHTQGLMDLSAEIMRSQRVGVDTIRATDYDIAPGVWPDMTEHGWERDDWPSRSGR